MKIKHLLATAALTIASAFVNASLISNTTFRGETDASFTSLPSNDQSGLYIWSQNNNTDWSVRWLGGASTSSWFGLVSLTNAVDNSFETIMFENTDRSLSRIDINGGNRDRFRFVSDANNEWDGFDFSVSNPTSHQAINFLIGGSIAQSMTAGVEAQKAANIFIGEDFANPNVLVQRFNSKNDRQYLSFSVIQVPEPGSLALLGLGLAGVGLIRFKQKQA